MAVIFETENFSIESAEKPFVSREEGGHIRIFPKIKVSDRTKLSPSLAIEYMKLSMLVGEALVSAMARRDVEIGIVNYQDMGNWTVFKPDGPIKHLQIFGRAKTATVQKYGEAVSLPHRETGFYDNFKPLDKYDIAEIKKEIEQLMKTEKYSNNW
jgi:hypothetical protein